MPADHAQRLSKAQRVARVARRREVGLELALAAQRGVGHAGRHLQRPQPAAQRHGGERHRYGAAAAAGQRRRLKLVAQRGVDAEQQAADRDRDVGAGQDVRELVRHHALELLAREARQQLQGVVAHEFAHILSGTYVTVTVSCLLFGIYSSLGDKLEAAALAGGGSRAIPVALAAVALRGWLWALQVASSVTNAALSRERELQADFAAARYTRDPLSLAEALRVIGRHPGGGG